ncbi:MAG: DUF1491 family protein [Hyphomicrobiales bacterium]|nr:DUF1491 family protein [Hyphomicrobiales bacterium]
MARLRSDFWVSAYLRQRSVAGVIAVLRRRGAAEAGAIFIKVDMLDGQVRLFGPAPPSFDRPETDGGAVERRFEELMAADPLAVEDRLVRELRFDADLWIIEVEDRSGSPGLPGTQT